VSYATVQSVRQIGLRGAAPATDERAADWPTVTMTRYDNGDIHAVDGRARLYSISQSINHLFVLSSTKNALQKMR